MVNYKHLKFTEFYKDWERMRNVFAGDKSIKKNSKLYIPMLSGQSEEDYQSMIKRQSFENFTGATAQGIGGLIFAKEPLIKVGSQLEKLLDNVDLCNRSINDISQNLVNEVLEVGRAGILIDMPNIDTTGMTIAQVEALNIRPYMKIYQTESIINWKQETINNSEQISMLVLFETYEYWKSEFESVLKERYRVYSLVDGICTVRIFEEIDKKFAQTDVSLPMMNGKPLDFIPFIPINEDDLTIDPKKPPLSDIANINLDYYYLQVERRNALHYVGIPTAYVSGVQLPKGQSIPLGSSNAQVFPDPNATMNYLELKADGIGAIEKALEDYKNSMLALGVRLLSPDSANQISENTMQMKTASYRARITRIADTISRGVAKALNIMEMWLNEKSEVEFQLNTDYNLAQMDAQTITSLVTSWQTGAIRQVDLFKALQRGEIIDESVTFEEYQSDLENNLFNDISTSTVTNSNTTQEPKATDTSLINTLKAKLGIQ